MYIYCKALDDVRILHGHVTPNGFVFTVSFRFGAPCAGFSVPSTCSPASC